MNLLALAQLLKLGLSPFVQRQAFTGVVVQAVDNGIFSGLGIYIHAGSAEEDQA